MLRPIANAAPALPATTLPPDLIERLVRVRAWYLDYNRREQLPDDKFERRFYAATGLSCDQYRDLSRDDPQRQELNAVFSSISNELPLVERYETECDDLCDERWAVAEAIINQKPQTVADLAWQAEAYLIADLEILHSPGSINGSMRMLFHHIKSSER